MWPSSVRRPGEPEVAPWPVVRVREPAELPEAFAEAKKLLAQHRVPVVVEVILERITNVSMGTELDNVTEFEDLAERGAHAPSAIAVLD